jgi:hypothetical protein
MPPGFTQSVRSIQSANYYYTASCGKKFTSPNAAWAHHDPSGEARRVFDEAKEAAKVATKRAPKEVANCITCNMVPRKHYSDKCNPCQLAVFFSK